MFNCCKNLLYLIPKLENEFHISSKRVFLLEEIFKLHVCNVSYRHLIKIWNFVFPSIKLLLGYIFMYLLYGSIIWVPLIQFRRTTDCFLLISEPLIGSNVQLENLIRTNVCIMFAPLRMRGNVCVGDDKRLILNMTGETLVFPL